MTSLISNYRLINITVVHNKFECPARPCMGLIAKSGHIHICYGTASLVKILALTMEFVMRQKIDREYSQIRKRLSESIKQLKDQNVWT